jgi:hypothetical protein
MIMHLPSGKIVGVTSDLLLALHYISMRTYNLDLHLADLLSHFSFHIFLAIYLFNILSLFRLFLQIL